jgi:hypothetical protein
MDTGFNISGDVIAHVLAGVIDDAAELVLLGEWSQERANAAMELVSEAATAEEALMLRWAVLDLTEIEA